MMGQGKIKVKENDENAVEASKRRSIAEADLWSFLEEVEAPMWADLTLEAKAVSEDSDDAWFHTSHPFHHHSAHHLRSVFAHPNVGNDLFYLCSPKVPSSVSKSRGKDYRSRDWKSNCCQISLDEDNPVNDLGGMISVTNTVSSQECKSKVSHEHQSGASSLITSLANDSERRVALNSQSGSASGVSTSTITTVSTQQDLKVLEVSKEAFGQTGGLLDALRTNLRKSRATRPASRVEKCDDRESNGCKFSTGKSSVGSSSSGYKGKGFAVMPKIDRCKQVNVETNVNIGTKGQKPSFGRPNQGFTNPKFEVKKMAAGFKQNKDRNSNIRDLRKLAKPVTGRVKAKNISEASVCTRNTYRSKIEGKDAAAVSSSQAASKSKASFCTSNYSDKIEGKRAAAVSSSQAALKSKASVCMRNTCSSKIDGHDAAAVSRSQAASKSKVLRQTTQKISLNQSRTGVLSIKGKVQSRQLNKIANSGKENMRERTVLSHRSGGKDNKPVVRVSDHKVPKSKSKAGVGVTSIASKVRIGRMNDGIMSADTRAHLR